MTLRRFMGLKGRLISLYLFTALSSAGACGAIPSTLLQTSSQAERAYGLPKNLLVSLIWAESRYCTSAVSEVGAQGLGQLMPGTARELGVTNAFDPTQNLYGSARYLRQMWELFQDWPHAILAYHDGPGNVRAGYASARGVAHVQFVLGTYDAIRRSGGLVMQR
ncbi:transglycosylase SLT domain-containing protein [Deinococcus aquatilis]|uniref:transglycosylase SLT domain-containing protein n=1 Tax=Deinococcus aquatilis TaxID=519440 RepID=UPI00036830C2